MPGGVGPGDLHQLAEDVLAACVASLDEIPNTEPTLKGAPERQLVSPGEPVWDCCEQLAVHPPGIGEASTSTGVTRAEALRSTKLARIPMVRIVATITRCLPQGDVKGTRYTPPSADDLTAAAAQINADGWALHNGIYNRIYQGVLTDVCSEAQWEGIESATPAGGCGGWTLSIRFQLDGYGATTPIGS